jgi:hypothetical protein
MNKLYKNLDIIFFIFYVGCTLGYSIFSLFMVLSKKKHSNHSNCFLTATNSKVTLIKGDLFKEGAYDNLFFPVELQRQSPWYLTDAREGEYLPTDVGMHSSMAEGRGLLMPG